MRVLVVIHVQNNTDVNHPRSSYKYLQALKFLYTLTRLKG